MWFGGLAFRKPNKNSGNSFFENIVLRSFQGCRPLCLARGYFLCAFFINAQKEVESMTEFEIIAILLTVIEIIVILLTNSIKK
jgi:hypothetical protein